MESAQKKAAGTESGNRIFDIKSRMNSQGFVNMAKFSIMKKILQLKIKRDKGGTQVA